MNEVLLDSMPLSEKAAFIQQKGHFIEAQDFYSFFVLVYTLNKQHIKLLYDFSGMLVSVETDEEDARDSFITDQLRSSLSASE